MAQKKRVSLRDADLKKKVPVSKTDKNIDQIEFEVKKLHEKEKNIVEEVENENKTIKEINQTKQVPEEKILYWDKDKSTFKRASVNLHKDTHKIIKRYCINNDISLIDFFEEAIIERITKLIKNKN